MTRSRSKRLLRTTDLVLATYLHLNGNEYELVEEDGQVRAGHPQGAWEFAETEHVTELVSTFNANRATVEPVQFHNATKRLRRDMFKFLGIGT